MFNLYRICDAASKLKRLFRGSQHAENFPVVTINSARYCDTAMKPMTEDQKQALTDRLNTNRYLHGMRSRMRDEMRRQFVREKLAEADAAVFNKVFTEAGYNFTCLICGKPMQAQRSTKQTCSDRCRTRLSRLSRAIAAAEVEERIARNFAEDEKQDHTRLSRVDRAPTATTGGERRFVIVG
jgi:hypothetical protein